MKLEQKNVFITGSSRGIGLAIAHKFASLGANVVLNSRGEISEELLAEFKPYGVKVLAISGDVSDFTDAKRMVEQAIEELGSVDILVNNAGITQDTLMLKMTEEDFEKVLKVNLTGAFNMTQAVLKQMIKAREGAIINMSSVVGLMGNIGQANYAASKAGLIGFTNNNGNNWHLKIAHLHEVTSNSFTLTTLLCTDTRIGTRSVDKGYNRTTKFFSLLHQAKGFSIAFWMRLTKVTVKIVL